MDQALGEGLRFNLEQNYLSNLILDEYKILIST